MRRALLIVGKAPEPGRAKTRLVPPLTPTTAAYLYAAFLQDTLGLVPRLGWEQASLIHPAGAGAGLAPLLPASSVRLCEQHGTGLGDALRSAFAEHLDAGFEQVVLIGSDSPTLPQALVERSCAALDAHDVSIGPSLDGGYYLLGLRAPHLGLFDSIDWSTPRVFGQTLGRAHALGLRVHTLPAWYDVDQPADVDRLREHLKTLPASVAPRTRRALDEVLPAPAHRARPAQAAGTSSVGVRPLRSA